MGNNDVSANIFNIERFATEDGPGIRTVVFLKGCDMRCVWCANPESQLFRSQILFKANACVDCGRCLAVCPRGCVEKKEGYGYITDGSRCELCGRCAENCYADARTVSGEIYSPERLLEVVLRDRAYYETSGGGITFSGGEPLFHADFIHAFRAAAGGAGMTVLIETCGHVPRSRFETVLPDTDLVYYDFKHVDPDAHRRLTGVDNRLILSNLVWLDRHFDGYIGVRYPYVPGRNDAPEDIRGFLRFVSGLERVRDVWFLPYHRLGAPKYLGLGREYALEGLAPLRVPDIEHLKALGPEYGLTVRVE
jgi:pyruvate formate lyase activating enzyme